MHKLMTLLMALFLSVLAAPAFGQTARVIECTDWVLADLGKTYADAQSFPLDMPYRLPDGTRKTLSLRGATVWAGCKAYIAAGGAMPARAAEPQPPAPAADTDAGSDQDAPANTDSAAADEVTDASDQIDIGAIAKTVASVFGIIALSFLAVLGLAIGRENARPIPTQPQTLHRKDAHEPLAQGWRHDDESAEKEEPLLLDEPVLQEEPQPANEDRLPRFISNADEDDGSPPPIPGIRSIESQLVNARRMLEINSG